MELNDKDLIIDNLCTNPDEYISILKVYVIRVEHKPTGIIATCGYHKAQHKNLKICKEMIEYALVDLKS